MSDLFKSAHRLLSNCYGAQRHALSRKLQRIKTQKDTTRQHTEMEKWLAEVEQSAQLRQMRVDNLPDISYPQQLPVSQKRDDIVQAIKDNQVVIIAGETGSGKTTQLPKMCLEAGRGINGLIGHTQPRRLAARSVCNRIAEELNTTVGEAVGFKVRFSDHVKPSSYIKLMTDGILLAELQQDRFLNQYDTIIIDEAHERSLNIDFILGYLKTLLHKRKDLKIIITSATIDPERFSEHFEGAPIFEVSGRTYPVEVRYRPPEDESDEDRDQMDSIMAAVDELQKEGPGDILVFLNGEREIRDTAEALEKRKLRHTEILPLFARLSAAEQNRIFQPHNKRRIVLATNVAETSLTVPGIRSVIDPGTARISRYSYRTKVQRLPIEPISQASANQRMGRCGRVEAGICIRLYSEDDFNNRPEFTDPEILRTNLASVILQMLALKLGDIEQFPFVQAPDSRSINDGRILLEEIGAVEASQRRGQILHLTDIGRKVAKLPIDPRLARMVITAKELGCLHEVMVITAGLSIQDPRERPMEAKQASDDAHEKYLDKDSDFIAFINLWNYVRLQQEKLSGAQFRKFCRQEFLAYMRVREWQDIYNQLQQTIEELKFTINQQPADNELVHRALLTGLLSHLGTKDAERGYIGARNAKFQVFPGSNLFKKQPKWLMSAELVETSRLFARNNAKIDVSWVEDYAQHLVKRNYNEPHWEKKRGSVVAIETQTLYGLPIVQNRRVTYSKIDPVLCRELFIREALVNGQINFNADFLTHNQQLILEVEKLEEKSRRRDILVDEEELFIFYEQVIPEHVLDTVTFKQFYRKQKDKSKLKISKDALMKHEAQGVTKHQFPDQWQQGNITLKLDYQFEPSQSQDGVTVLLPLALLNQIDESGFDWTIPGYRHELIVSLIKSLPKALRRNFVPAPNFADACLEAIEENPEHRFLPAISKQLLKMTGVKIPDEAWDFSQVPDHLTMSFQVVDENTKPIAVGKSLSQLKHQLQGKVKKTLSEVADDGIEQSNLTQWTIGHLPKNYSQRRGGYEIKAFPALRDDKKSVSVHLFDSQEKADWSHVRGVVRLICLNIPSPLGYLQEKLPNKAKLGLYFNPFGQIRDLIQDCIEAALLDLVTKQDEIRDEQAFTKLRELARAEISDWVLEIAKQVERILTRCHQINKRLKGKTSFDMVQSQADIKAQLESLVFKGFVSAHGVERLKDIERYVEAVDKRLEKLAVDSVRDRLNRDVVEKVMDGAKPLLNKVPKDQQIPVELENLKWMIEELRVSLFAQTLGTAYPISAKRINNQINELKKQGF